MKRFKILFLLFGLFILPAEAQTYHSSLTEYRYGNYELLSPYKWRETSIIISNDTITIISHQKNQMEAQRWAVNNKEVVLQENSEIHQYFTQLVNTPNDTLLPAKLSFCKNKDGIVEFIDLELPPVSNSEKAAHITTRFHVNYTF